MLYSCTHMKTVGVKGLKAYYGRFNCKCLVLELLSLVDYVTENMCCLLSVRLYTPVDYNTL